MKKKLPKVIIEILSEAPMPYGLVVICDYRSGKSTAKELKRNWDREKKLQPSKFTEYKENIPY